MRMNVNLPESAFVATPAGESLALSWGISEASMIVPTSVADRRFDVRRLTTLHVAILLGAGHSAFWGGSIEPSNARRDPHTDTQGRITRRDLIPGVSYRVKICRSCGFLASGSWCSRFRPAFGWHH
jgi:hypothetical protein